MEHIHKVIYINLDHRLDRRVLFEKEMETMGINAIRYSAIKNSNGAIGCHMSHLEVLKFAKAQKYPNVLIMEDDFEFLVDKQEFNNQLKMFFDSRISYDVLMLAYNMWESEPYNDLIGQVKSAYTTAAYIVNSNMYDELINNFEYGLEQHIKTGDFKTFAIDVYWIKLQKTKKFFYFKKRIGKQRAGYSDIQNKDVDYNV